MADKLALIEARFEELGRQLAEPDVVSDIPQLQRLSRERAEIKDLVAVYRESRSVKKGIEDAQTMLETEQDPEMQDLAREELETLKGRREQLLAEIRLELLPKDPYDVKDTIVEIRAGTGGQEASLFAGNLFRMYSRYAERKRWRTEIIDKNESDLGGFKEIIFEVKGKGAYSRLKYESGVHRVQRVPVTEAGGRLHTSTSTVAVLPEAEEVEINVSEDDLRVDIFHSGGAGGQNVNKVATAVRLTHLPTGIVVTCQDERSQLKNRTKAMAVLRARLLRKEQEKQEAQITQTRRSQVGTGERAEKIRTYNFPQDRITDHRIGLSWHNLPGILDGELDAIIDAVATADQAERLQQALEPPVESGARR
ncbi:MAG: peptide chain release factor 1 [Dehalococcoidia bacterium]|nr:peptide chain release factor 1 [Dehalococcoidia bacterium]